MTSHLHPTIAAAAMLFIAATVPLASAAAYENLAILDNAALFPQSTGVYNPGLGPRQFVDGMPAIPALPPFPGKAKRQDQAAQCPAGKHSCLDLGPIGATWCCDNDQYCFLNQNWEPKCCGVGAPCGSPCAEDLLYCNGTATVTTTVATSPTTTVLEQTSLTPACCGRACSSTSFLCQVGFGGQCCPFGASCGSNSQCLYPPTSSQSQITPVSSGCIACSTGGGCCNVGSTCTSSLVSATSTAQLCAANLTIVRNEGVLSEGARVGIGVGVAVAASLIIGGVTWFWIHRRRVAKSRRDGGTLVGSGHDEPDLTGPFIPPGAAMSDVTSPSSRTGMRPRLHEDGLAYPYFGADAVPGPYTDREDNSTPSRAQGVESRSNPGFSEQAARAANRYPDAPRDIVRPVELGTQKETRVELGDNESSISENDSAASGAAAAKEERQEAYELYGSPVTSPIPMTFDEAERQRAQESPPPPDPNQKVEKSGHE
ncbi:hypothetical protein F5Y00DRAFT_20565 [Daldinia vernicosa]|uniref:uncharacterized protein n=1 Tax=Daldinia vernicosa TaxID=114800 RepID=UPI0020087327|nr:uncharacterized protein F5Y00DRAFT_20565 [Daldinia vernicosa]KAI0851360.1 hypothetical protein F5Y00DRAFT_20565 [Daldinia vernicosa]